MPATVEEIDRISFILRHAIERLIQNDSDIFNIELIDPPQISEDAKILNRQLHEVAINHRLAYYLERYMEAIDLSHYHVDIEYNRYYGNPKMVETVAGLEEIRPDI